MLLRAIAVPWVACSTAPPVFQHFFPQHVSYGIQLPEGRAPFAFGHVKAEDLMNYLREDPDGPFTGTDGEGFKGFESRVARWGFEEDTINEALESILKADWHATAFQLGAEASVFVPRTDAFLPSRQPPRRILAFLEAFRQVSAGCWGRVAEALAALRSRAEAEESVDLQESAAVFHHAMRQGSQFGGLEAQIWRGGDLVMDSHTDGATALLHLSLTLGGRRVLRISRFRERHSPYKPQGSRRRGVPPGDEVSVWNDEAYYPQELCDFPQVKGSVYISSPFCFEHGVKYESSFADPVFALQCRFAFANLTEAKLVNGQRTGNMREVAEVVADALSASIDQQELRLPSLDQVKAVEKQISIGYQLRTEGARTPMLACGRSHFVLAAVAFCGARRWHSARVRS
ncbi:unnamed protein product, partial [Effrenium voratum]